MLYQKYDFFPSKIVPQTLYQWSKCSGSAIQGVSSNFKNNIYIWDMKKLIHLIDAFIEAIFG